VKAGLPGGVYGEYKLYAMGDEDVEPSASQQPLLFVPGHLGRCVGGGHACSWPPLHCVTPPSSAADAMLSRHGSAKRHHHSYD
jgi:hypothetical protein